MNYLACGTVAEIVITAMFSSPYPWMQGSPLCFSSAKAVLHPVDRGTSCVPLMLCDPLLPHFLPKVNLGKSAVGG